MPFPDDDAVTPDPDPQASADPRGLTPAPLPAGWSAAPSPPTPIADDPRGLTPAPLPASTPDVSPWRKSLAALVRGGSNLAGRILGGGAGAILGTPADVAVGPAGTVGGAVLGESLGGGLGSAAGEYLAEKLEGRAKVNPYEIAGETALGAVPIPGGSNVSAAVRLARAAAIGGGMSAADTGVHKLGQAAEGDNVDLSTLPTEMLHSGAWGAVGGAALEGLSSAVRARMNGEPAAAPTPPTTPVESAPGQLHATLPPGSARAGQVTRAGQVQGLDPATFRSVKGGAPAPPRVVPDAPPPATTSVFDAINRGEGQLPPEPTPVPGYPQALNALPPDLQAALPPAADTPLDLMPYDEPAPMNSPNAIAAHALDTNPPRGVSSLATGNPDLDALLGGDVTPSVTPEPLELPTRDTEGTEHYDITPPELQQAGLDLSGTSDQRDLGPAPVVNNGSGAPGGGSAEEIARTAEMQGRGETFVKYNRAGQRTVIGNGAGAQDVFPGPGETTGIEGPNGFQVRDDNGGNVPASAHLPAELRDAIAPEMYHGLNDQPSEPGETFDLGDTGDTGNTADTGVHPAIADLHAQLGPQWDAAVKAQEGDNIPFTVDPHESLPDFAHRLMTAPPSELMSGERKVRAILDAMKDEAGSASTPALVHLAGAGIGGLAGAALDPQHPLKAGLEGAAAGLGVTMAMAHPEIAEKLRYFGLFASPMTVLRKGLGDAGSAVNAAFEHATGGDLDTAKRILSHVFSPQTAQAAIDHFRNSDISTSVGETVGPTGDRILGAPSRAMGAITEAMKDAYARAGLDPEEAERLTFSGEPTTAAGKAVVNAQREGGPLVRLLMPTAKTIVNIAEKNFQTLPGVGALPLITKLARGEDVTAAEWGSTAGRQAMGLLIGGLGYARGAAHSDKKTTGSPSYGEQALHAMLAPYMMTEAAGEAVGHAFNSKPNPRKLPGQVALSGAKAAILRDLPVPTGADFNPEQWAAEFAPSGLRALSSYAPNEYEQPDVLDPLVAKIPLLNDMLLTPKRSALRGPQ